MDDVEFLNDVGVRLRAVVDELQMWADDHDTGRPYDINAVLWATGAMGAAHAARMLVDDALREMARKAREA